MCRDTPDQCRGTSHYEMRRTDPLGRSFQRTLSRVFILIDFLIVASLHGLSIKLATLMRDFFPYSKPLLFRVFRMLLGAVDTFA